MVGTDPVHRFPAGAMVEVPAGIIAELVHGVGLPAPDGGVLVPVEVMVLDVCADPLLFQPAVVLLAAIPRVGGDIGRLAIVADMLLQVRDERGGVESEEHTSELQSRENLVCRLLLEKKKDKKSKII